MAKHKIQHIYAFVKDVEMGYWVMLLEEENTLKARDFTSVLAAKKVLQKHHPSDPWMIEIIYDNRTTNNTEEESENQNEELQIPE